MLHAVKFPSGKLHCNNQLVFIRLTFVHVGDCFEGTGGGGGRGEFKCSFAEFDSNKINFDPISATDQKKLCKDTSYTYFF